MNRLWLLLPFILFFFFCSGEKPSESISKLQERIDAIAKKIESGEGLRAKSETEDFEILMKDLKSRLDELEKELKEINKRLNELNTKYESHLKEFHK
jgi:F0F1-type ATP synthase membrane subunit b/b'